MTRITPFEHVFGPNADEWFATVRQEAQTAHKNAADRAQFATLASVQQLLAEIEAPETVEANPTAPTEYLLSLYAAYRFWSGGQHVFPIATGSITDPARVTLPRSVAVPHGACYLQLAEQAFWGQIAPDAPHEPVDGIFVADFQEGRELTAVAVLGFRPEREGFSQIGITVAHRDVVTAVENVREVPFKPIMEGGERAGFHSIVSTSELLCLVRFALAQVTPLPLSK